MSELCGKVQGRSGCGPGRADYRSRNNLRLLRWPAAWSPGSVHSKIFPGPASKTVRWQTLILFAPDASQRNSKASTARSVAVQDLPRLTLVGLMRVSEPNGVRVAKFSSI